MTYRHYLISLNLLRSSNRKKKIKQAQYKPAGLRKNPTLAVRPRGVAYSRDSSLPPSVPASRSASTHSGRSSSSTEIDFEGTDVNDYGGYEEEDEKGAAAERDSMKSAGRTTGKNTVSKCFILSRLSDTDHTWSLGLKSRPT